MDTRRRRLCRAIILSFLAASLVGCGNGGGSTAGGDGSSTGSSVVDGDLALDVTAAADAEPRRGGTLRYAVEAETDGLNPTSSALSAPGLAMANAVFDTLTAVGADGETVPYLARSFESSADAKSWTIVLRDGISFHDGTPLDASAVAATFEAQRSDPLVGLAVRPFFPETGAVEVLDPLTVRFNVLDPDRTFPDLLSGQGGMVASPQWLAAAKADPALNQQPVGTGPFRFDSRTPDSTTRFVRNEDWWAGSANLDAIEFRPVPDADVRADLLASGEVQAAHTDEAGSAGDLLDDDSLQTVFDETGEEGFVMLNSSRPPFDDLRARQALALATPLENYRSLIGLGVAQPADQMFVADSAYYDPDVVQEGDDPEAAVALAADYCADVPDGCTDGRIRMTYQFSGPSVVATRSAEILEEGWRGAFDVSFDEVQQDEGIQQVALGEYEAVGWRQFGALDPAGDNLWLLCRTIGGISLNWPRYCDEELDALLLEGQASEDEARRAEIYREVSRRIDEAANYIFLTHSTWVNAFTSEVRGACDRRSPEDVALRCSVNGYTWHDSLWLDR